MGQRAEAYAFSLSELSFPDVSIPRTGVVVREYSRTLLVPILAAGLAYGNIGYGAFRPWRGIALAVVLSTVTLLAREVAFRGVLDVGLGFASLGSGIVVGAATHAWPSDYIVAGATLVTAGAGFLAVRAIVARGDRDSVLRALAWSGAVVAAVGLIGVGLHHYPWARLATGLFRLSSTIGYANATGAVLALSLGAALLLLYRRRRGALERIVVFTIASALPLTFSRGALGAVALSIGPALALGAWPAIRAAIRPLIGAGVVGLGALPSVISDIPRPVPMAAGVVVGLLVAAAPVPIGWSHRAREALRDRAWRYVIPGTSTAIVLVIAAGFLFVGPDGIDRLGDSRLDLAGEGRLRNWSGQLEESWRDPLLGQGYRTYPPFQANRLAHNEYLQAFHDGGIVGLASVAAALVAFGIAVWRRRPTGQERVVWAVAASTGVVFAAHSAVDFLWRYPVVVLIAFTWLAIAVTPSQERGEGS
jgi:hypothetical protein